MRTHTHQFQRQTHFSTMIIKMRRSVTVNWENLNFNDNFAMLWATNILYAFL